MASNQTNEATRSQSSMLRSVPHDSCIDDYEQMLEAAWMRVSRTDTRYVQFGGEIRELAMHAARENLADVLRQRGRSLGRVTWAESDGRRFSEDLMLVGVFGQLLIRDSITRNEVWIPAELVQS